MRRRLPGKLHSHILRSNVCATATWSFIDKLLRKSASGSKIVRLGSVMHGNLMFADIFQVLAPLAIGMMLFVCHFIMHFVCHLMLMLLFLQVLAPLAIGMTLFVCHLIAIPVDGCS